MNGISTIPCLNVNSTIFKTITSSVDESRKTLALFNKDWNTYKTNWQNANGIGGKIGSIFASSNANTSASVISNDQVQILRNWNNAVKHGYTDQATFNRIIANADENTKMYFAGLNKGKGSIEGLKNAQKVATQSTIGLTIAQTALNMAITMGITALASLIMKGYDELANSVENCKERVDDLMSSYKSALDTANNNANRVEELADKYEDLSKGVNNLGENVSLTNEEYQEYNSLVNEIADMFPTLVQGYTDEGNAILNLKGNVEQLRDAYKEAQQEAYNLLIVSGEDSDGNDIIKQWEDTHDTGFWSDMLDLGADDVGGSISVSDALEQLRAIQQMSADEYREIERITGSGSRKEIAGLTDIEKEIGYGSYLYKALGLNSNSTDEEFREAQRQAKALIQTYNAEIESALSDVETLANAYLMTNEDYDKLDAQSKSAASMIVNNLNADIANGFSSKEDVATYVDGIVQAILPNDKAEGALTDLFTMDTSDMSISEIESQVDSYINTIADALNEDPVELKTRLGFDNSDTEPLVNKVKGFLSDEFDNKVGELTLDELDIASELQIPEGTLLSWDELIAKIREVQGSTSDNEITYLFSNITTSKDALEDFISAVESASDAYSTLMNPNISSSDILYSILSITEAVSEMGGKLNWELIDKQANSVELLGDTIDYISEKYTKSALVDAGFGEEFAETLANSIVQSQKATRELDNLNTQIDSLQSAYDNLTDIVDTYNETGYITFDQLQTLLALEPQYLSCLVSENGQLQLNQQSMLALANQRLNDAEAQAVQQAISELGTLALQDEKTAIEENAQAFSDAIDDLSGYNTELANTIAEASVAASVIRDLNVAISGAESKDVSDEQINTVLENLDTKLQLISNTRDNLANSFGNIVVSSSSKSSPSSTTKDTKETFDWIETIISRIQRTITNLGKTVSATYKKWSIRNNALAQEMSAINQEIATQQQAYDAYMKKANSVNLSKHYKQLVRNGGLKIEDITDESVNENIKLYQEWYEKALDCEDAITDLQDSIAELAMTKFDNISKQYDDRITMIEHHTSMLEGYVSRAEAAGFWASEVYYQKMAEKELENINQLQDKYNDLTNALNQNVANGSIEQYSEDWYEMRIQIDDVESALQEANTTLIEFNQTLQQIHWDIFDRASDYKDLFIEEANFLAELISRRDLYNEVGKFTEDGLAVQGLHAVNYNAYMEKSEALAEEILKLNEEIANDPNDLELIDRRNELIGLQQEAIKNAMSEKDAIKDLVSNGYDVMLDSLNELIDKRREALDAERDLHDYQNKIQEHTDSIASYKKQLRAYAGDNSESAKATIQKLQLNLEESEKSLREAEYDKWLSDQQQLLDNLSDDTQEWVNQRLDNIDGLVSEAIQATNNNADTIGGVITETAETLGYTLSEYANMLWSGNNDNTTLLLKAYEDVSLGFDVGTTKLETVLNSIDTKLQTMVNDLNNQAAVESESIGQPDIEYNETNNYDTDDYEPQQSASSGITFNGGTFYEDSYKGGKTGNSKNQWTGHEVEVTHESGTGMVHIIDKTTGTILGWVDKDQLQGYATGTTNAKKGFNLVSEKGDELIKDKDGNIILAKGEQIFPFKGGETVFNAYKTAELLNGNLIPLSVEQLWGNIIKTPRLPEMANNGVSGSIANDIQLNIAVKANNFDEFCASFKTAIKDDPQCRKLLRAVTVDETVGRGGLRRNNF